ncbi:MAG: beta-lactamase family protein [Planctomyces sp.]|nr:beta-lactamase family protein [Planctomyces sp.]
MNGRFRLSSDPRELGLDASRWRQACALAEDLTARDDVPALTLCVVRDDRLLEPFACGRLGLAPDSEPVTADSRFVVASLTKPIVAMGIVRLAELGRLSLNDRVSEHLPEFDAAPKRPTTIRHLLTHTSGLPDMLPNNLALRRGQAPLSKFVSGACGVTLDFPPGRGVQYQSLGFALLGEIIARVSGRTCGEFLQSEFFRPLGMDDTSLEQACAPASGAAIAEIRVPEEMQGGHDWNWNSAYWRGLGAPWGGLISTAKDLAVYCGMMLRGGEWQGVRVLSPASVLAATSNQLEAFHDISESDRRTRPWGLGWRGAWPAHAATFGDLLSPAAYGHWGATGTLFWVDPTLRMAAVLLSTQPLDRDRSPLVRISNALTASAL